MNQFPSPALRPFVWLLLAAALFGTAAWQACASAVLPAMYPGQSDSFPSTGSTQNLDVYVGKWEVMDAFGNDVGSKDSNRGWSVTYVGGTLSGSFKVAAPTGASGTYVVAYSEKGAGDNGYSGPAASFNVVAPPSSPKPPAFPGPAYGWQGAVGGVNTGTGNKLTSIPIVSWKQRGGLSVGVTLYHNSESGRQGWLGPKWTFTQDAVLSTSGTGSGSTVTVAWGNGRTYSFVQQPDNSYQPPAGIYDILTGSGANWSLKTTNNVTYHFTGGYSNGIDLTSVTDLNNNTVLIHRASSGQPDTTFF